MYLSTKYSCPALAPSTPAQDQHTPHKDHKIERRFDVPRWQSIVASTSRRTLSSIQCHLADVASSHSGDL